MSHLVSFDQAGVFGPAMTLIYNCNSYDEKELTDLTKYLKKKFLDLAKVKIKGRKDFCAFVQQKKSENSTASPSEIIYRSFFLNMRAPRPSDEYHDRIISLIVPRMMQTVEEHYTRAKILNDETLQVHQWTALFLQSYIDKEKIAKLCSYQGPNGEKILDERKRIGTKLYGEALAGEFTERDLLALEAICRVAANPIKQVDHLATVLKFADMYANLFAMNEENPKAFADEVLQSLMTTFKQKFFANK